MNPRRLKQALGACLLVTLLALAIIKTVRSRRMSWAFLAGGIAGLAVLARFIFALWLPGLAAIVLLGCRRRSAIEPSRGPVLYSIAFLTTALLVPMPWMIRKDRQSKGSGPHIHAKIPLALRRS